MSEVKNDQILSFHSEKVEMIEDDDRDTNVLNFISGKDYFCVQISQYLEGDQTLDLPYFEYCDQSSGRYADLDRIILNDMRIEFYFSENQLFAKRYLIVKIDLESNIDIEMVDFMLNSMFLGSKIEHQHNNEKLKSVQQHTQRSDG